MSLATGTEQTSRRTPLISLFLAYIAMVPVAAGPVAAFLAPPHWSPLLIRLDALWCGALLCFFAGVRRGLSFRQDGGPALAQLAGMLWLFILGIATITVPQRLLALLIPLLGFVSMRSMDIAATARHEAPLYFARLRRAQLWVPIISLCALIIETIS